MGAAGAVAEIRELIDTRNRLFRERVARLEIGPNLTRQDLYERAIEIAPIAALPDPETSRIPQEEANIQIMALSGDEATNALVRRRRPVTRAIEQVSIVLDPISGTLPLRDPLGRPWTSEAFFTFVVGVVFAAPSRRSPGPPPPPPSRWRLGPNADRVWGHRYARTPDDAE
jgi:hypothetical protein